jgi:simple sugar transport system ATP-binding protein
VFPHLTVAENLFINAQPTGRAGRVDWRSMRLRAQEILDEWGIRLSPDAEAARLGVEERQQVEIARALATGSRFLILDEPTARLERPAILRLFAHIAQLRERGVSVLYISHYLEEIYEICDTVTVLRDGRLIREGQVADLSRKDLVAAMVGERQNSADSDRAAAASRRGAKGSAPERLRVEGLTIAGWCTNVSFGVRPGELVGLAGLAGSGKRQVAEAIGGLRKADTGSIRVDGEAVRQGDVQTAIRSGIGFVPQDRHEEGFAPNLDIEENITLTALDRLGRFGTVSSSTRRGLTLDLMSALDVAAHGPTQQVAELSGGNQQKVVVGRALVTEPRVLVVISPTAGVDVASKEALFRTLTSLPDLAVLIVSDELDDLGHCDRVLVMFDGEITTEFESRTEHGLVAAMEGVEGD